MIVVWCMEMRVDKNRIKFGLLLAGWSYEEGDPQVLLDQGRKVLPSEFESRMLGDIFCPVCKTSLTRSPKEKANYVNGRSACFKHLPSYSQVDCPLRVPGRRASVTKLKNQQRRQLRMSYWQSCRDS